MTQIEIVDLLKESGVWDEIGYPTCIDNLIDLVAAHEREKCAKVCEEVDKHFDYTIAAIQCAAAIRARNNND